MTEEQATAMLGILSEVLEAGRLLCFAAGVYLSMIVLQLSGFKTRY